MSVAPPPRTVRVVRALRVFRVVRIVAVASVLVALLVGLAACSAPVALKTQAQPFDACEDALLAGGLTVDPRTGLGIAGGDDKVTPVVWPFGFSARNELGKVALVDRDGKVIAHEGDRVELGGGLGAGDEWFACAQGIRMVPNTGG